jgi:hypothetical protein
MPRANVQLGTKAAGRQMGGMHTEKSCAARGGCDEVVAACGGSCSAHRDQDAPEHDLKRRDERQNLGVHGVCEVLCWERRTWVDPLG